MSYEMDQVLDLLLNVDWDNTIDTRIANISLVIKEKTWYLTAFIFHLCSFFSSFSINLPIRVFHTISCMPYQVSVSIFRTASLLWFTTILAKNIIIYPIVMHPNIRRGSVAFLFCTFACPNGDGAFVPWCVDCIGIFVTHSDSNGASWFNRTLRVSNWW